MENTNCGPRAKRQKIDKNGRFAALAKLKELKGSKHKYEIDNKVDDVYEVVDEKEYAKKAKELYGTDWIEEDGSGYAEDGRDFFEDEDYVDEENMIVDTPKQSKKRSRNSEKPEKSKGSLRNMFLNAAKKPSVTSIKDDDILADILGELKCEKTEATTTTNNRFLQKQKDSALANEYMDNFMKFKNIANNKNDHKNITKQTKKITTTNENTSTSNSSSKDMEKPVVTTGISLNQEKEQSVVDNSPKDRTSCEVLEASIKKSDINCYEQMQNEVRNKFSNAEKVLFNCNDFDISDLDKDENQFNLNDFTNLSVKVSSEIPSKKDEAKIEKNMIEILNNWESVCHGDNTEEENSLPTNESINTVNMSSEGEAYFSFWYWEAWEDATRRPGEVFLFGRTVDGKSVCVRIENVDRVLYLLPREYLLDAISLERTKQKVTLADLYKEFDEKIAADLKLTDFRSRKVSKYFANHPTDIEIPQQCDYLEIHYNGKKPPPNIKSKYVSIAHIFGANTTALERFLLDRKIKGPCWLKLKQFSTPPAPFSWCKGNINVSEAKYILRMEHGKPAPPPPLVLLTLNVRTSLNPKTGKNEVCMIAMLVHNRYHIDKAPPQPCFNRHMCSLTRPIISSWPLDFNAKLNTYKATKLYKHDTERALLSWFLAQYQQIDADLIITYDAMDCQLDILTDRIITLKIPQWSRLGRLRLSVPFGKKMLDFFIGRMVCDVKRSAEECIRSRSYDLQTLCTNVLNIKEGDRIDINEEELHQMYEKSDTILKLITLTMQDAFFILRLMYDLNIMPLALQITNICGNIMTRTLQSGRSERNEYLLLHAFTEKNYIVPDKKARQVYQSSFDTDDQATTALASGSANATSGGVRKKAAYSGGLVLEPLSGLYDKYILLLDFNSLYPSIIQEYNICFTTVPIPKTPDELPKLPDQSCEVGILPQQLKRLVDSRREVKKLMAVADLSPDLKMQYHIRQMALKLTANSMYGCLGFANSRFFAQHLAALVTHKGREILTNTQALVQRMNYVVVYGDTDSIMVNTNITDFDQALKIGTIIKQNVNKYYKQLELDIDGVFSCLLLLKKKKYAAVKITKTVKGDLRKEQEHKGLDIVRRDWSQIAIMVGKAILDSILSDKSLDDKLDEIHSHLERVRDQILNGEVPMPMFVITKQLSRPPTEFNSSTAQPHVQVALRMNTTRNRRYKKGDMVDYVICEDGTTNPATHRAYHLDELRCSESLKIDNNYYLSHQIHPVVMRMLEVLDGTDASRIAECLGLDGSKFKRSNLQENKDYAYSSFMGESLAKSTLNSYSTCEKFKFKCVQCKEDYILDSLLKINENGHQEPALLRCSNNKCTNIPYENVIIIRNQLLLQMRQFVKRFYQNWLVCDESTCNQNTRAYAHVTAHRRPVCIRCKNGSLIRQYTAHDLYTQLNYFQYIFDVNRLEIKNTKVKFEPELLAAYQILRQSIEQQMDKSAYAEISLAKLFHRTKL